jgi:hypothetical protein
MNEKDVLAIHFKYCMFIAVMILITIATDRWSSSKDFTTYLSNAATMTSLVLGVIAILYSFVSNDSMARSLGSITTVTDQVRQVKEQIAEYVMLTADSTQAVQSSGSQIRDASDVISGSLVNLDETLKELTSQNQELRTLLGALPTRFEQLETKVGDFARAVGEKPVSAQPATLITAAEFAPQVIAKFFARASLSQNLLTHACVLSYQSKKPLAIPDLCKAIGFDLPNGFQGFLNCMNAIQLCWRKPIDGKEKTYMINFVHPELVGQSKSYYVKYIDETYSDKPEEKAKWLEKLDRVEQLFASEAGTS